MNRHVWILVVAFSIAPAFAQDSEEAVGAGTQFALGNLAVRDLARPPDPVQELKAFFVGIKLPLSSVQERKLPPIFEAHRNAEAAVDRTHTDAASVDMTRKLNQEYLKRVIDVLTPEQQAAWRHYRIEQIRLRGGYPALKSTLEELGAPLGEDQEKSIQQIFDNFAGRRERLTEANQNSGIAEMDRLTIAEFNRIVALLTSDQRKALQASRRTASAARRR